MSSEIVSLEPGTTLGPYNVTAKIGEGGMGEVYRATDTSLDRQVAIKVLPEAFAGDADRLARFEREAKVLASLNHPNIGAIYGLEKSGDIRALVLELVEGPTLADRIAQGPIPVDEALPIAKQIAEALEAAHEAGVIHRDLKPANIKVREDGTVKVLDFGLAKALDTTPEGDPSQSPTLTAAATQMGVIMGTAAYMSPEQAAGKVVDKRGDIWSFGVVLFEMLTGQRLFTGETVSHVLGAVLQVEPKWDALPTGTPPLLRRLLRRCLQKERKRRLRDVGDALTDLDDALAGNDETAVAPGSQPAAWRRVMPWVALAFLAGGTAGLLMGDRATDSESPPRVLRRFSIRPPTGGRWNANVSSFAAVSPGGSDVVYVTTGGIYHHPLSVGESVQLPSGSFPESPFFSPDGQWVAYFSEGSLWRLRLAGGSPLAICTCDHAIGIAGSWGPDDSIIFADSTTLWQVPASGGEPQSVTTLQEGEDYHDAPQFLPDGRGVLFTVTYQDPARPGHIAIHLFDTGERHIIVEGRKAYLTSSGHLVYGGPRGDTLWAVPFDTNTFETNGEAVLVLDGLRSASSFPFFALGEDGTLVYLNRESTEASQLVWVDREGREEPLPAEPRPYFLPKISPDGQRIVVEVREPNDIDIWVYNIVSATLEPLAVEPQRENYPLWTTDGQHIIFTSQRDGLSGLFKKSSYGTGQAELLSQTNGGRHGLGWSGTTLILGEFGARNGLFALRAGQDQAERLFEEVGPYRAAVSPDGEWVAYNSAPSGTLETWVRPVDEPEGRRLQVSQGGGNSPTWSPDGAEVFYRNQNGDAMIAATFDADAFTIVERRTLFEGEYLTANGRMYDISPDGERFLMVKPGGSSELLSSGDDIQVVSDWFEELKRLVPEGLRVFRSSLGVRMRQDQPAEGGLAVKRKRFSVEQITTVLQQAESGVPIGDLCRQVGISEQSFYRWRKVYGNLQPSEARELKQLREENAKLKRLVADLSLDRVMLQDVVKKKW